MDGRDVLTQRIKSLSTDKVDALKANWPIKGADSQTAKPVKTLTDAELRRFHEHLDRFGGDRADDETYKEAKRVFFSLSPESQTHVMSEWSKANGRALAKSSLTELEYFKTLVLETVDWEAVAATESTPATFLRLVKATAELHSIKPPKQVTEIPTQPKLAWAILAERNGGAGGSSSFLDATSAGEPPAISWATVTFGDESGLLGVKAITDPNELEVVAGLEGTETTNETRKQ